MAFKRENDLRSIYFHINGTEPCFYYGCLKGVIKYNIVTYTLVRKGIMFEFMAHWQNAVYK